MIGAGTFGANRDEITEGSARSYNLLEITSDLKRVRIYVREQPKPDGAWRAWNERWATRKKSWNSVQVLHAKLRTLFAIRENSRPTSWRRLSTTQHVDRDRNCANHSSSLPVPSACAPRPARPLFGRSVEMFS